MKFAILSDSHDNWTKLKESISIANDRNCDHLFFAGDLVSPSGIEILSEFKNPVHFIWGNNEGEKVGIVSQISKFPNIMFYGDFAEINLNNYKIFIIHKPELAKHAALSGQYNLVIFGHTHKTSNVTINQTLMLNPGAISNCSGKSSFMIIDTHKTENNVQITNL